MPLLDVSDVLDDPDFQTTVVLKRSGGTVGSDGRATYATTTSTIAAVVTAANGMNLARGADGRTSQGSITIHTRQMLYSGEDGTEPDVIEWRGNEWTVVVVNDFSEYGAGFVSATAEIRSVT